VPPKILHPYFSNPLIDLITMKIINKKKINENSHDNDSEIIFDVRSALCFFLNKLLVVFIKNYRGDLYFIGWRLAQIGSLSEKMNETTKIVKEFFNQRFIRLMDSINN
jgi:hypothetical protein